MRLIKTGVFEVLHWLTCTFLQFRLATFHLQVNKHDKTSLKTQVPWVSVISRIKESKDFNLWNDVHVTHFKISKLKKWHMHTRLNVLWSYLASNKASINVSCKTFGQVYEGQYITTGHYFSFHNLKTLFTLIWAHSFSLTTANIRLLLVLFQMSDRDLTHVSVKAALNLVSICLKKLQIHLNYL